MKLFITCLAILIIPAIPTVLEATGNQQPVEIIEHGTSRTLAIGDFAEFNELFQDAVIHIPDDFKVSQRIAFIKLELEIRDTKCYDISVGSINVWHDRRSRRQMNVNVDVTQLDLQCDVDYRYKYGFLRGGGTAVVRTNDNSASTHFQFYSEDFNYQPPNGSVDVGSCNTNIQITDINFKGDLVSDIVEWFEKLIRDVIEEQVGDLACDELASLGTIFVDDMLDIAGEALKEYASPMSSDVTDPLYPEHTFQPPSDMLLLNFQDTDDVIGGWFKGALREADQLLGTLTPDADGPKNRDLGVNIYLRKYFLEEDRSFTLDMETMPFDAVLFQGHDRLTESSITIKKVKIFGLDTFTKFDPLIDIGKYTLQNRLAWEYLSVEFDVEIDIKPSTRDDSLLDNPQSKGFVELVRIDFAVQDVEVLASLLIAIDQEALGDMELGPLLWTDNLMPCLLSVVNTIQISGLGVTVGGISEPTLNNFVSPGIDRVVTDSVEAAFDMYYGALQMAIPSIFETTVRDIINTDVITSYLNDPVNSNCPEVAEVSGFVDFRDFLLNPQISLITGGSGQMQFGDLGATVFELLQNQLLSTDDDGSIALNSYLRDMTESQSGTPGTLHFPSEVVSFLKTDIENDLVRSFVERFEIKLFDTRVRNLDILKAPVSILQPKNSANILANLLTIGPAQERPLNISMGLLLKVDGADSPLSMHNEMDLSIAMPSGLVRADLLLNVVASKLFRFPLSDVLDYNCWLATIPAPELDSNGIAVEGSAIGVGLAAIAMSLSSLDMDVNFVSSTSPGVSIIPDLLYTLRMSGGFSKLKNRIANFGTELLQSEWVQTQFDRWLVDAPRFCPHSTEYDDNAVSTDYGGSPFPDLTSEDIDTLLFATAVVAEVGIMVFVESHRLSPEEPTSALSAQDKMASPGNAFDSLIDWTDLNGDIGSFVDVALVEMRSYLGGPMEDGDETDLGINVVLRDWLLGDDGVLALEFDDLSFELPGAEISLGAVRINGLDSFTSFDIWEPIAPQTIQNTLSWEKLSIELVVSVTNTTTMTTSHAVKVSLSMKDIAANIPLFIALDQDKLGDLELGSFMNIENILPCLISALRDFEITQTLVTVGTLDDLKFDGLMSDTSKILVTFTEELFSVYHSQIIDTLPLIFDTTVRKLLNGIVASYIEEPKCPGGEIVGDSSFIDFRRFFDSEDTTYGDVPPLLKRLFDSQLLEVDSTSGMPRINDVVIAPFTKRQSGDTGMLQIVGDIFDFGARDIEELGIEDIEIRAFDPIINNLDTVAAPLHLLQPNISSAFLLDNAATLGLESLPLRLALKTLLSVSGDPVFDMHNELDISVEMVGADILAVVLAKVRARRLFDFPLRDIMNSDCWLSILSTPKLDKNGIRAAGIDVGLALETMTMVFGSMRFGVACTSCTSKGLLMLPEVLERLEVAGVSDVLEKRLLHLAEELLESDYVQAFLDRLLVEGSKRCPSSSDFVDSELSLDYKNPSFPYLSYDSLESIAFASTMAINVAAVIVAESHASYEVAESDPLAGQKQLESDGRLIDFSSLKSSIGEWADIAVEQVLAYLSKVIEDSEGPGGKDLQVNNFLRSLILDSDNFLTFEFIDVNAGSESMKVSLKKVRITGLDSISSFNALDAIGPQTLRNQFKWRKLGVQLVVTMAASNSIGRSLETEKDIIVSLELSDVDVSLAFLLALDLDLLGSLQMGSILEISHILPCFLSAARKANLTELKLSVGSIDSFSVDGFRSAEIQSALSEATRVILEDYGETILSSLPGFFDVTVRAAMNNWISFYMGDQSNVACPVRAFEKVKSAFIDFRDLFLAEEASQALGGSGTSPYGDLFRGVLDIVKDLVLKIDPITGFSAINDILVGPFTRSQSSETGSVMFPGDIFNQGARVSVGGLDANVKLIASDARIDNLDTVRAPLSLLDAVMNAPYELNNTATLGTSERPLRFATRFLISLTGDDNMQINNELDISLDLETANLILRALLKISESRFLGFPLRDTLNLDCWLATIPAPSLDTRGVRVEGTAPTLALEELAASIAQLNLNISCVECSSPGMYELTRLLESPEAKEDATEVANMILDYVTQLMGGNFLQVQIDRILSEAASACPHSPSYDPNAVKAIEYQAFETIPTDDAVSYLILLGAVTACLILAVALVVFVIRCIVRRRHQKWLRTLPSQQTQRILSLQGREQAMESEFNDSTKSMFRSPDIPRLVRWLMPLIIVANIGFFLSGHLSLGATVNIEAELAGEKFRVEKFFEFSMAKSTFDIWNAGGKALAVMILIFSGIWPYTKQLITLALWFLSPSTVSISRRGSTLLWLDWLAKWSMVDIFVLVISIAAFRVSIVSPELAFLPKDFYSINLLVVPLWGLYSNMIAQLISQVSSHFIIHYHRQIVEKARQTYKQRHEIDRSVEICHGGEQPTAARLDMSPESDMTGNVEREELRKHTFGRPHRGESEKLVVRRGMDSVLLAAAACLTLLVILGCALPSLSLEVLGIIGVAVESGQGFNDARTEHSLFTIMQLLFEEARFLGTVGDYIGLGTLSILLLFSVLIVPIVQSMALLRQWFYPTTRRSRARMSIFIECLQAWQYAEVYLVAVFVASWQLGPVSQFMINSYCDSLEDTFAQLVYYGILAEEDAQCFSVRSSIEGGSFMLAAGAVLLALLNTFVVKAVIQYFRDKDELEKRCLDSEPSDVKSDHTSGTASEEEGDGDHAAQIHPVPVLFTDTFRWTLRRDNEGINSSRSFVPEAAGKQDWALVEATVVAIDEDRKYNQSLPVAVLEEDVQSKGPPELDAWKTGYRLKPPVPRPMSDTDEELSSQEILEQSVMEDHFFTVEEELIMDTNQVYGSEHNDAQSEYTEEILEDDDCTEQSFFKNP